MMPRLLFAVAWFLLAALPLAATAEERPPRSLDELEARLSEGLARGNVPGAALVVIEGGEIVLARGFGVADRASGTPVTPDTVFRAGSISKTVTALAVFQLVQEGALALDARLDALAPEIGHFNPHQTAAPVRLVHLLEHTTGWPDIGFADYAFDGRGQTLADALARNARLRTSRWRPGVDFAYSNAGPAVAGRLVELATGRGFAEVARTRVLRPLGMAQADFELNGTLAPLLARSYAADGQTEIPFSHFGMGPSASLLASARELAQLPLFFINSGRVGGVPLLDADLVARMERSDPGTRAVQAGLTVTHGAGTLVLASSRHLWRGHDGRIDGFTTSFGYDRAAGAGYVLLMNGGQADPALRDAVMDYLLRGRTTPAPAPSPDDPDALRAQAGHYQLLTTRHSFERLFADLAGLQVVSATAEGLAWEGSTLVPAGAGLYRVASRGEPSVAFVTDAQERRLLVTRGATLLQVPLVLVLAKWAVLFLVAGLLASIVLYLPVWMIAAAQGRAGGLGGVLMRVMPVLGLVSALAVAVGFIWATGFAPDVIAALGAPTPAALGIFLGTIGIPAFAVLGLWLSITAPASAGGFGRLHTLAASLALLALGAYLGAFGWIGWRTWI